MAAPATAVQSGTRLRLHGVGSAAGAAALTLYASFNAGGYFADTIGVVCAALLVVLALRVAVVERPFAGWSRSLALAAGALTLFAAWSLLSVVWSDAPGRAILEFDRVLVYLLVLVAFASSPWSSARLLWAAAGIAVAAVVVAGAALASRLMPDVFPTAANIVPDRLSFPLTYWNALALLAAIGLTLCLHFACGVERRPALRAVAAAAVPPLAATLLLTYSRGGVAVALLMVGLYLAVARPPGAFAALLATGPATAVALAFAYRADLLASTDPTSPAAAHQGHRVAVALAVCSVVAGLVRLVLARRGDWRAVPTRLLGGRLAGRRTRLAIGLALGLLLAIPLVRAGVHQVEGFSARPAATTLTDTRNRLTDPSSNGRVQYWRAALDAFESSPLHGTGAGTYQLEWWRHRTVPQGVTEAHSLYLQSLGELGVVGLVLLLVGLVPLLAALVRRLGSSDRALAAALVACAAGWAVHAGLDWDWQVPAVTLWLFAVGGIALSSDRAHGKSRRPLSFAKRAALGLALVSMAGLPALVAISQSRLDTALDAYEQGDCQAAVDAARQARSAMPPRPEPRALLGWCAARGNHPAEAIGDLRAAVARDPGDWEDRYGLAVVLAASGRDPRGELAVARRLDPLEPAVQQLAVAFAQPDPRTWKSPALEARLFVNGLDYPPLGR